ncbi:MAG: acyl-CoA thioesterase [Chitinophagaceae bacterium]|nr:acyl-CoA thioesterase [Chitinophagaceae bacterium]
MFTSETKIRVRYSETDKMGVVYHSHYFAYFESARAEAIRQLGYTYAEMEREGILMPVTEVQCRYLKPARYDDLLTIQTKLNDVPLGSRITFEHEVFNENGDILAKASVTLYFLQAATLRPVQMPEKLRKVLFPFFKK